MARATIEEISRLFAAIGITPTLAGLGLPADKLDWTAEQALGIDRLIKNNPRPFDLRRDEATGASRLRRRPRRQRHLS